MGPLTDDTFFDGRVRVRQYRKGYRFSIDAVLLAHYACKYPVSKVLDLGTGCGIIPLILAFRNPEARICGVEIQKELAEIARCNISDNAVGERVRILWQDMRTLTHKAVSGPADLVVSNPPYRKARSGRINPDSQRAIARHEITATLADVVGTARRMLNLSGRFVTIYPAERMAELLARMQAGGIEPKFLRPVYSGADTEARLILAEGVRGGRPGMKLLPPLVIYAPDGGYTQEVSAMFQP